MFGISIPAQVFLRWRFPTDLISEIAPFPHLQSQLHVAVGLLVCFFLQVHPRCALSLQRRGRKSANVTCLAQMLRSRRMQGARGTLGCFT